MKIERIQRIKTLEELRKEYPESTPLNKLMDYEIEKYTLEQNGIVNRISY